MRRFALWLVCLALLASTNCSNPKGQRITEQNKETFLENDANSKTLADAFIKEIQGFKNLSKDDADLLARYVLRHSVVESIKGDAEKTIPLVDKTVGEIIQLQKQWDKEQKEEAEKAAILAAEAKAREEAIQAELRNSIQLTVFDKDFIPSNYRLDRYEDNITISIAYENRSTKDIRAFQGIVIFNDLFGDEIFSSSIKISDPIKAGQKATWIGAIEYNQFRDEHKRLKNADMKDLKVVWKPAKIIFSDGTTLPKEEETK